MTDSPVYRFHRFELRPQKHQLVVDGRSVTLGSRALDVLEALASRAGHMMTKQELLDRVWPDTIVQEANLAVQISTLRKELGPEIIATIPGRGYRLIAAAAVDEPPLEGVAEPGAAPLSASPTASPTAPPPTLRTNLPAWTRPLLGRDADLAALRELVQRHRIVTIAGSGGMGKTLLARHLLLDPPGDHRHGVCWVELASTTHAAALPATVAAAMGLELGSVDSLAQLAALLAPLDMLLALDNAEHLLGDVAALAQSLHDLAPGVRVLVTSQAPLRIPAECVYRLQPLAVPAHALDLKSAMNFGAVALLVERALAADARFVLTDELVPTLVEICHALDGVPLALELAAARAPMLGLPRLMQSLRERLRLLTVNSDRWAPPRQQTLREAHEWSYRLLAPPEQEAFRRLGVLVGSASLATMQAVASNGSPDDADAWAALDSLTVLADRSLIVLLRTSDEGQPDAFAQAHTQASASTRYRLLDSSRLFALEQLQAHGELTLSRRVHAQRMAHLCDAAWDARWSGEVGIQAWTRAMEPELDDALEAFGWASSNNEPGLALRIARTLLYALPKSQRQQHTRMAEFCETCQTDRTSDTSNASDVGDVGDVGNLPTVVRVQAWLAVGSHWTDVHMRQAAAAMQQALPLARRHVDEGGDPFWLCLALSRCALIEARRGDLAAALQAITEMRAVSPPEGTAAWPPHRLLVGVLAEGYVARCASGDPTAWLAVQRRLLALQRAAGGDIFQSLNNLMDAELAAGDAASAVQTGTALMRQLDGSRDEHLLACGRVNLVAAWLALGEPAHAREVAQTAWPASCRFTQQAYLADYLALLACQEHRFRDAARLAGYAQQAYGRDGNERDHNEAAAFERAVSLANAALGPIDFDRLATEGRTLSDDEVFDCAFAEHDG